MTRTDANSASLRTPTSKLQFVVVREICANAERVFDILTSESGMNASIPLCRSAHWRHAAGRSSPEAGSVRHIVLAGGLVAAERVIGWIAGREFQYTFDESSIPLDKVTSGYVGACKVDSTGTDRSRLTWSVHFDTSGWTTLSAPLVRANLRMLIGTMASRVGRLAETRC